MFPTSIDRTLISNYVRGFVPESISVEFFKNLSDEMSFSTAEKLIITESSVNDVAKLLGFILNDIKTYVFSINLKSFENALESVRTILSLYNPNLTKNNIEHLIGMAEPFFVYVDRNEDGLFIITDIAKVVYKNNVATLDVLFGDEEKEENILVSPVVETDSQVQEDVVDDIVEEVNIQESVLEEKSITIDEPIVLDGPIVIDEPKNFKRINSGIKINKYKKTNKAIKIRLISK